MASFNHIGGAEPSTLTFKAATVVQVRNSSNMHQELISIADPESSLGVVAVLGAAPASTTFGLVVRRVGDSTSIIKGDSTSFQGGTWTVRANLSSTSADNPVRANLSSTGTDNPVSISGNSTAVIAAFAAGLISSAVLAGNSSALNVRPVWSSTSTDQPVSAAQAGAWTVRANLSSTSADNPVRANLSSTATDNPVAISGNSTAVIAAFAAGLISSGVLAGNSSALNVRPVWSSTNTDQPVSAAQAGTWTFTLGTGLQSTAAPSSNSSGIIVRQVIDNILTTPSTNAFAASTALVIQSSGAGLRSYVTGYSITSTVQAITKVAFYSSANMLWPVALAALSSAFAGVNLAVSAPAYLFRTNNQSEALTLNTGNSTIAGFKVGVSYFRAP